MDVKHVYECLYYIILKVLIEYEKQNIKIYKILVYFYITL